MILGHWYQFPAEARADPVIRKRIYALIGYLLVMLNACNERNALTVAMLAIPKAYQPIMAIILPLTREFDLWLLNSLGRKAMGGGHNMSPLCLTDLPKPSAHSSPSYVPE